MDTEETTTRPPRRSSVMGVIGTILLAIGFLALNVAWAITDPFAADANIGAGGLILLGRLTGSVGLLLIVLEAILRLVRRNAKADRRG